jgi:hypothetical protein
VSTASQPRIGPFEPKPSYEDDIADTGKVESWIVGTLVPGLAQ